MSDQSDIAEDSAIGKCWALAIGSYSDHRVLAIHLDRSLAEASCARYNAVMCHGMDARRAEVEEMPLMKGLPAPVASDNPGDDSMLRIQWPWGEPADDHWFWGEDEVRKTLDVIRSMGDDSAIGETS